MNISKRDVLELIGVLSVVASLVFVGIQLYFDRSVAIGSQQNERTVLGQDYFLSQAWKKNPELYLMTLQGAIAAFEENVKELLVGCIAR
jgi:hypothetical protein